MPLSMTCELKLELSLQTFLKDDTLDNKDKYKCEKCEQCSKAKIRNELCKLPTVLVFHLKRFTFPQMKKIKGKTKYPPMLDMKP